MPTVNPGLASCSCLFRSLWLGERKELKGGLIISKGSNCSGRKCQDAAFFYCPGSISGGTKKSKRSSVYLEGQSFLTGKWRSKPGEGEDWGDTDTAHRFQRTGRRGPAAAGGCGSRRHAPTRYAKAALGGMEEDRRTTWSTPPVLTSSLARPARAHGW